MKIYTPMYGSNEPGDYDAYAAMLKGYQDTFKILFTLHKLGCPVLTR